MTRGYFVTGTDTEIGKTLVCAALLHCGQRDGLRAIGMKPVAAGTVKGSNEDVQALCEASSIRAGPKLVNPYLFDEPIAPHIAATHAGVTIELAHIKACFDQLANLADVVIVEGVGGFKVPLSPRADTADMAKLLALPVVLVVGMRLGCINHALLTQDAIAAAGLRCAGWVANRIDPAMRCFDENFATLETRLAAPCLGVIPHLPVTGDAARVASTYVKWPGSGSQK